MNFIAETPLVAFTLLLLVILIIPPIFERLRLPGLVGLLVAGICLGSDGLGVLSHESETMQLLSDIGKIYLMFVAGLEIDLAEFRKTRDRSLSFGIFTFIIPMIVGTGVGFLFDMGPNASILLGSLMASHTLLGYPIVNRLGVARTEAVTITIGATIFTDIAALLVLAICISIHAGDFTPLSLITQLGSLALYCFVILVGFGWAGKEYFRRTGDEEGNQFLFILLVVFIAAVGAQLINIDKIVGAFLVGLAVNDVLGHSPVEEKVVFVGSTLFIPFFFVDMGLLIDFSGLMASLSTELRLTLVVVGGLIGSKLLAALATQWRYHYSWVETATMWSLSIPQVAATLAAALAGVQAGLLSPSLFNAVIVLMFVTSILGPVLTAKFARNLPLPSPLDQDGDIWGAEDWADMGGLALQDPQTYPFTVLIPVHNPNTQRYLIEMGSLLARHEAGRVIALAIARSHVHMDEPQLGLALTQSHRLLQQSITISQEFQMEAVPLVRIDDDIAHGISRAAREQNASLVVMGWSPSASGIQARLFGNIIDSVFWASHCPVAVVRLVDQPINLRRILVPIKVVTPQALQPIRLAHFLAGMNQASVTLLHVCDRKTPTEAINTFEDQLQQAVEALKLNLETSIQSLRSSDVAESIVTTAEHYDLVILRSMRRRTAGGLAVSDVTTQVIDELHCSLILYGEPHT